MPLRSLYGPAALTNSFSSSSRSTFGLGRLSAAWRSERSCTRCTRRNGSAVAMSVSMARDASSPNRATASGSTGLVGVEGFEVAAHRPPLIAPLGQGRLVLVAHGSSFACCTGHGGEHISHCIGMLICGVRSRPQRVRRPAAEALTSGRARRRADPQGPRADRRRSRRHHPHPGRPPNHLELAMYAVMWSEHCSYKSSRIHLRRLPSEGPASWSARARTQASSTPATGSAWRSASRATTTRRPSSRIRARRPASAGSCATCSPWGRGPRLMDPLRFGPLSDPAAGGSPRVSSRGSAATETRSGCRPSAVRRCSTRRIRTTHW